MTAVPGLIVKIYSRLLRLYPASFRSEFEEQMLLDFTDMAMDASKKGGYSLLMFYLHELFEFPINLLRIHLKEGLMFKVFRSQPVNYGLRGALGYGVVFGLAILISEFVNLKLFVEDNSIIGNLQVFYFDLFHTEHGLELIGWLPNAIASLLSGLVLGILFAVLFADRANYRRYILSGMLGWFLHDAIRDILWHSANLDFFLGTRQGIYLSITELVLSYPFLALIFIVAKSEKSESMRSLAAGSIAYPLITYVYIQLLFKLAIIETLWMFIALMILMVVYIGSIFVIALRSGVERKAIWIIPAGILISPLLSLLENGFMAWLASLISLPVLPSVIQAGSSAEWQLMFRIALDNSIFGVIFGLIMGLIFGLLNKRNPQQVIT